MEFIRLKYKINTAEANMSEDLQLLETAEKTGESFFRCYGWQPAAVTIGRFQKTNGLNTDFCKKNNIDIVRRPTGGKAILHNNDFTFAIVIAIKNADELPIFKYAYTLVNNALAIALKKNGAAVELKKQITEKNIISDPVCFNYSYNHEIVTGQKKIVGTAQRREKNALLIQGNVHLTIDYKLYSEIFCADDFLLKSNFCSLSQIIDLTKLDLTKLENSFFTELATVNL